MRERGLLQLSPVDLSYRPALAWVVVNPRFFDLCQLLC